MRKNIESLMVRARLLGAEFQVDGTRVSISAPKPLPTDLMRELRARKAAVLSYLALPEEYRSVVRWASWLVEYEPQEEATVSFQEAPLRTVTFRLSEVGRYVTERLGSLSLLCICETASAEDLKPGWRVERMTELCGALAALQESLAPFGLADHEGSQQ